MAILPLYTFAIFLSAMLLFSVQPMFAKMVLPVLGGAPQVWNTCMVFFQAALLGGYAYAHYSVKFLGMGRQVYLHLLLLLMAFIFLPFALPESLEPPRDAFPAPWLLWVMTVSIGLPFFLLSSTGPLVQKWFTQLGHHTSSDPYYLYAASNLGSVLALLLYPLVLETQLTLSSQRTIWAWGYLLLALCLCGCIYLLIKRHAVAPPEDDSDDLPLERKRALRWIVLAFVPSSMMLGLTSFVTADIAATPLLWVIPLALYLLSFTIAFAKKPLIAHGLMVKIMPACLLVLALCMVSGSIDPIALFLPLHLFVFFVVAMVCHGELAKDRPPVSKLTLFYLLISIGGVLGGIFNALFSPVLFDTVIEYPLILVVAAFFCPLRSSVSQPSRKPGADWKRVVMDVAMAMLPALCMLSLSYLMIEPPAEGDVQSGMVSSSTVLVFGVSLVIVYLMMNHPLRFALGLAIWMLCGFQVYESTKGDKVFQQRSYFGIHRVMNATKDNANYLYHGSVTHGMQSNQPELSRVPGMYFHPSGPAGQVLRTFADRLNNIAIIGLGTGALAAYAEAGQRIVFLEIDPLVKQIAETKELFSYVSDARMRGAEVDTLLGDARITLQEVDDGSLDIIILDAFSSGAIPAHLITKEAVELYLTKIRQDGYLLFHISNNYLKLHPIVARIAKELDLISLLQDNFIETEEQIRQHKSISQWMLLMPRGADQTGLQLKFGRWRQITVADDQLLWTDEFSSIVKVLKTD